ncbi:MAG: AI-2E family transporter, partial [Firmicutes bacterium]|nr:AI-2E family transporter [Bacillota bacterium]
MKIKLEKQHYQWGLTAFLVVVCSMLFFFAIFRSNAVADIIGLIVGVMSPIIYGLVMAYLLCPIYNQTVSKSYAVLNKGKYKFKHDLMMAKVVGSIVSVVILLVVIGGVLWMIIPGLVESIIKVVEILPSGLEQFNAWIDVKFNKLPFMKDTLDELSQNMTGYLIDFVTNKVLPESGSLVASVSGTIIGALSKMLQFLIGIIVCVYFLNIKDTLAAQAKKLIVAFCKEKRAEEILAGAAYTNKTFSGFISGKIIDSIIIGILCFIVMTIFGWEYSLLISCIIGITNIIPFFGPFIGAVPSALL